LPIIEQANGFGAVAVGFTRLGRNIMESRISLRQQSVQYCTGPMGSQCYQQLPSAVYHWTIENRMCTLCYIDDAMKKNIAAWARPSARQRRALSDRRMRLACSISSPVW
jgi:hypothetical protein